MPRLYSDDRKRRIAEVGSIAPETRSNLANARYTGSAHHKTRLADYGFIPPTNPRPDKSVCDDVRIIRLSEATRLFRSGIAAGMVSSHLQRGLPKYVWAVDGDWEVYEAKLGGDGMSYHGYRLSPKDDNHEYLMAEWRKRTA